MDPSSLLIVGVEVSVAFAGFAGIIATFQFRDESKIRRGQVVGLTMIVYFGLMAAFLFSYPLLLSVYGVSEAFIWTSGSIIQIAWYVYAMYFVHKGMKTAVRNPSALWLFRLLQVIAAIVVFTLILNVSNLIFHREPGPYLSAVAYGLFLTGYMFARLLLRPLWRAVREKEKAT